MSSTARRPSARPSRSASSTRSGALPRVVPFAAFIALLAASPLLEGLVDARWLAVGRGLVAAALLACFWGAYTELRAPSPEKPGPGLAAIGLGIALGVLWVWLDFGWTHLGDPGSGFVALRPDGSLDPALVLLRLFGFVLVVPVMEELFWRSFLMRRIDRADFLALDPRAASAAALVLTSAVFALEHREWLAGLVAGLAYGTLYRRTGNLRLAVASHASTNLTIAGWVLATGSWRHW
jgi:CAAX prenyl protease-like protein